MSKPKTTTNAVDIINKRYYKNNAQRQVDLQLARTNNEIACKIYNLRKKSGLTQEQLAQKIGTTASVISRLENDDYDGHSIKILERIAAALSYRVNISFSKLKAA